MSLTLDSNIGLSSETVQLLQIEAYECKIIMHKFGSLLHQWMMGRSFFCSSLSHFVVRLLYDGRLLDSV